MGVIKFFVDLAIVSNEGTGTIVKDISYNIQNERSLFYGL